MFRPGGVSGPLPGALLVTEGHVASQRLFAPPPNGWWLKETLAHPNLTLVRVLHWALGVCGLCACVCVCVFFHVVGFHRILG